MITSNKFHSGFAQAIFLVKTSLPSISSHNIPKSTDAGNENGKRRVNIININLAGLQTHLNYPRGIVGLNDKN